MSTETTQQEEKRDKGITVKELRAYLTSLPVEFDDFGMVNGEVAHVDGISYSRLDKPIVYMAIDQETNEFVLLHQTMAEVNEIINGIAAGQPDETPVPEAPENGTV